MEWRLYYLTATAEVSLLRRVDVEFGLVGSLALILSGDLQGQSVIVANVNLVTVTEGRQRPLN